jgi:hypothetical protein
MLENYSIYDKRTYLDLKLKHLFQNFYGGSIKLLLIEDIDYFNSMGIAIPDYFECVFENDEVRIWQETPDTIPNIVGNGSFEEWENNSANHWTLTGMAGKESKEVKKGQHSIRIGGLNYEWSGATQNVNMPLVGDTLFTLDYFLEMDGSDPFYALPVKLFFSGGIGLIFAFSHTTRQNSTNAFILPVLNRTVGSWHRLNVSLTDIARSLGFKEPIALELNLQSYGQNSKIIFDNVRLEISKP